ncbi:hypothetical protein H109_04342 [Trichophyton interdigitale MR816]|uniref:Uncharacterized protein n=1 Tax=Trichophyton interdigitale (strain MR816) TaxID=1215338 RepID=A0A059J7H0_TRIIM|nr:hypothetical protein H109_04342 [Trichophyton interdigitale MR816]
MLVQFYTEVKVREARKEAERRMRQSATARARSDEQTMMNVVVDRQTDDEADAESQNRRADEGRKIEYAGSLLISSLSAGAQRAEDMILVAAAAAADAGREK